MFILQDRASCCGCMRMACCFVQSVADMLLLIGAGWHEKLLSSTAGSHRKMHHVFKGVREVK